MATDRDRNCQLAEIIKVIGVMALKGGCAISFVGAFWVIAFGNDALAQSNIVPDATLGAESSFVVPNFQGLAVEAIGGGTQRGQNLFHSFQEFNVSEGRGAYFFSPDAAVRNILARVTGGNRSTILGIVGTFGNSQPNLFLINPNGIVFGQKAQLDVAGSFVASTANSLVFNNGFGFSATNPQAPPLLTITTPIGLQYGANPGRIVNQSLFALRVQPGRTLALVGGDVALQGGILSAPDARIELGSVAGNSRVSLTPTGAGYALGYEGVQNFQDIRLTQEAFVVAGGNGGGSVQVQGKNVTLTDGSQISVNLLGAGIGGNLIVNASESVQLIGTSTDGESPSGLGVQAGPTATGKAGDLRITTSQLLIRDGAGVGAGTRGAGKGGNLIINASDSVQAIGTSARGRIALGTQSDPNSTGDAGDLTITTGKLLLQDGAQISAGTFGAGKGGNLIINASNSVQAIGTSADGRSPSGLFTEAVRNSTGDAGNLTITTSQLLIGDGARVSADTFGSGKGGNLAINASDSVQVLGTTADGEFPSGLFARSRGTGDAGDLTITTSQLLIGDGAWISASTDDSGKGGNLTVNASNSVQVIGTSFNKEFPSALLAQATGTGDAGELSITTSQLLIRDGGQVSASTVDSGQGGNLTVYASNGVQAIGTSVDGEFPSGLFTQTRGTGNAGELTITTSGLLIGDGARISTSTFGAGKGGNLTVYASEGMQAIGISALGRVPSILAADTFGKGDAGDVRITTSQLLIRDGARISASTSGSGKGGNLIVNASEGVQVIGTSADGKFPSSLLADVSSKATGDAGNLTITTGQLLVSNGARVSTSTFGAGKGGNLTVYASEGVQVIGRTADGRFASGLAAQADRNSTGDAGNLTINTQQFLIRDGAQVSASTFGSGKGGNITVNASERVQVIGTSADGRLSSNLSVEANRNSIGNAGDLTITTGQLLIQDGGFVSASTSSSGKGGNLMVNASDWVQVIGTSANSQFGSYLIVQSNPNSTGDAGNLTINTRQLLIRDGAQVGASTFGSGKGGSLTVKASDWVQVIGRSADGRLGSNLVAGASQNSTGNGGDLTITTSQLLIRDGAQVSAGTLGSGKGGILAVKASDWVQVIGISTDGRFPSILAAFADAGGTAGNLTVDTGQLSIRDGAQVTVSSPFGQAGNLSITTNSLFLNQGSITAETAKSGPEGGANITLKVSDVWLMGNESLISATASGSANGGNINIDSQFLVALPPQGSEGSDIIANAKEGNGGRINITTQGIFGIEYRDKLTPLNDITATSDFGLDGEVSINQPIDPSRGLAELPTNLVDAEGLIDRRCTSVGEDQRSSFVVTGRGGLPPNPTDPLTGEAVIADWITLDSKQENINSTNPDVNSTRATPKRLVEAQGWVYGSDGQVILTAQAPTVTPESPWQTSPSCVGNSKVKR